jgi:hypothetical protein
VDGRAGEGVKAEKEERLFVREADCGKEFRGIGRPGGIKVIGLPVVPLEEEEGSVWGDLEDGSNLGGDRGLIGDGGFEIADCVNIHENGLIGGKLNFAVLSWRRRIGRLARTESGGIIG